MSGLSFFCCVPDDLFVWAGGLLSALLFLTLELRAGAECWAFKGCFLEPPEGGPGLGPDLDRGAVFPAGLFICFFFRPAGDLSSPGETLRSLEAWRVILRLQLQFSIEKYQDLCLVNSVYIHIRR